MDLLALPEVRPEALAQAAGVVGDDRVRSLEDRLGGAVVLLELDDVSIREVILELEDVADLGSAEAVDRLILVADHRQVPVLSGEQLQQPVLRVVGVLVLVDQDPAEALAVAAADVLEELQHVDGAHQEVVEVHRVGVQHPALVEAVGLPDHVLEDASDLLLVGLGVDQLVLRVGDPGAHRPRRIALGVDLELLEAALQHAQRVGLVVDREPARVAEPLGLDPQEPRAGRVEGHHPHAPRDTADQRGDALSHLVGRLVGEGDREDLVRVGASGGEQPGDPVGQGAGLAGPCSRENQQRPLAERHRLALGPVEARQEALDLVGAHLDGRDLQFLSSGGHRPSIGAGPAG